MGFMETGGARKGQLSVRAAVERKGDECRGPRLSTAPYHGAVDGPRRRGAGRRAAHANCTARDGAGGKCMRHLPKLNKSRSVRSAKRIFE